MGSRLSRSRLTGQGPNGDPTPEPPSEYLPLTAQVNFNGHSLVDAIFSGADDGRQTLTTYHPDGPKRWRKWTVPGSSLSQRWLLRNGASDEQLPDPMPAPFDPENQYSPIIPARDLQFFDAMVITEGGPYTVPLNVEGFNRQWARSKDYFDLWRGLMPGKPVYFWTIWPATLTETQPASDPTWRLDPTDRVDIPPFLAFLDRYEKTAEQWCADNGVIHSKIIPGHRLYWELYCRFNDYDGRPQLPGAWADIWADDGQFIHANMLGSVFVSVMVYRWLFGSMPDAAIVNARLAEAETNQGITAQDVFDVVTATLTYEQGNGVDLQVGTFTMPTPFWDASGAGTANVIGTYTPGQPMGTNGLWWELPDDIDEMYLLLRVSHGTASSTQTSIFCANNTDWSWWDGKMQGLVMDVSDAGEGGRIGMVDGTGMMTGPIGVMGGVDNPMWVEGYVGPKGVRARFLNMVDEFPWLQGFQPRGTKSLPSTRIGVNVTWENNSMRVDTGNFAVHEGYAYLDTPDDLTRLRMLHHVLGVVP